VAAITWDDVTAIAPELEDVELEAQTIILASANTSLNACAFKPANLTLARILLAAHMATMTVMSGGESATGAVLSETVGGISRTYSDASSVGAVGGNSGSAYGDQLAYLIRTSRARWPRVAP
jgi:hypothetical protein